MGSALYAVSFNVPESAGEFTIRGYGSFPSPLNSEKGRKGIESRLCGKPCRIDWNYNSHREFLKIAVGNRFPLYIFNAESCCIILRVDDSFGEAGLRRETEWYNGIDIIPGSWTYENIPVNNQGCPPIVQVTDPYGFNNPWN